MTPAKGRGKVLAVVDLGSNAVRLQIAEVAPPGRAEVLAEDRAAVRRGQARSEPPAPRFLRARTGERKTGGEGLPAGRGKAGG